MDLYLELWRTTCVVWKAIGGVGVLLCAALCVWREISGVTIVRLRWVHSNASAGSGRRQVWRKASGARPELAAVAFVLGAELWVRVLRFKSPGSRRPTVSLLCHIAEFHFCPTRQWVAWQGARSRSMSGQSLARETAAGAEQQRGRRPVHRGVCRRAARDSIFTPWDPSLQLHVWYSARMYSTVQCTWTKASKTHCPNLKFFIKSQLTIKSNFINQNQWNGMLAAK